uniref:GMP synthase (glutamine-hydrolyzing) n=1 Tax=Ditylum brightwellii TaxID=49249 RepID=A0A7S4QLU4_9STRA
MSKIAILDPGAQYGKLIDKTVRKLGVESQIVDLAASSEELADYAAYIVAGGGSSVHDADAPKYNAEIFSSGKPILGICYGLQLIVKELGGKVEKLDTREDGPIEISVEKSDSLLFEGTPAKQIVLMTHGDTVTELPQGFELEATSGGLTAAIANESKKMYGVQFHPETDLTVHGSQFISNFLFKIAGLEANYTLDDRHQTAIQEIRDTVGDRDVLLFVSGGVDSTITALLMAEAKLSGAVHAVHVDHGMMRHNESEVVEVALKAAGIDLDLVRDPDFFMNASTDIRGTKSKTLKETTDPEEKRAIIGDAFIQLRNREIERLGLDADTTVLAMGTLRPDLIESASELASGNAKVIKTHHNDTPLVRELRKRGQVIEPLKELHKDEVRELGHKLGAPDELVWRHPFPGPGLGIRLLCAEEPYMNDDFAKVTAQLAKHATDSIKTTLLPVRTVGVQGDDRTLSYLAALSGNEDWPTLQKIAREIPKSVHGVNRIVYVFGETLSETSQDKITVTYPSKDAFDQLRIADDKAMKVLQKHGLNKALAQMPIVSFPVNFGQEGKRSIGIRTMITNDFMTGDIALPGRDLPIDVIHEMVTEILEDSSIARVVYDLTSKPPGTTEWE